LEHSDQAYLKFIGKNEGIRNKVYNDPLGIPTVGIGFNLERSAAEWVMKKIGANYHAVLLGHPLTDEQVIALFQMNLNEAKAICKDVFPCWAHFSANRKLALVDMAFNLGRPRLVKFKRMIGAVQRADWNTAADEAMDSKWYNQVKSRGPRVVSLIREG